MDHEARNRGFLSRLLRRPRPELYWASLEPAGMAERSPEGSGCCDPSAIGSAGCGRTEVCPQEALPTTPVCTGPTSAPWSAASETSRC